MSKTSDELKQDCIDARNDAWIATDESIRLKKVAEEAFKLYKDKLREEQDEQDK